MQSQSRRGRRTPASPFLPPQNKPKDINTIDSVPELLEILRRTNEQLARCSQTMRSTLETRRTRVEARLEHVSAMSKVTIDMRKTSISSESYSSTTDDVSMDDAVFIVSSSSRTSDLEMTEGQQPQASTSTSKPTIMETKAKILASPIRPTPVNKPGQRGIRMIDNETSIRIQQEETNRRMEQQRANQEAAAAKHRRLSYQGEEAARLAAEEAASQSSGYTYQEDVERRARILAYMNYRPDSDEEEEDDTDDELDDEAMEALLEAEYEDGTKGQTIVDPDDLTELIRLDPHHLLNSQMDDDG